MNQLTENTVPRPVLIVTPLTLEEFSNRSATVGKT